MTFRSNPGQEHHFPLPPMEITLCREYHNTAVGTERKQGTQLPFSFSPSFNALPSRFSLLSLSLTLVTGHQIRFSVVIISPSYQFASCSTWLYPRIPFPNNPHSCPPWLRLGLRGSQNKDLSFWSSLSSVFLKTGHGRHLCKSKRCCCCYCCCFYFRKLKDNFIKA